MPNSKLTHNTPRKLFPEKHRILIRNPKLQAISYKLQAKSAFTLIELLIVIVIIGILAVLIISSYTVAYRKARLDIGTENVISALKNQKTKVTAGYKTNEGEEIEVGCLGVTISLSDFDLNEDPKIKSVAAPYDKDTEKCDLAQITETGEVIDMPKRVGVSEIEITRVGEKENLTLLFYPPNGKIQMDQPLLPNSKAKITLSYGKKITEPDSIYTKVIIIDPVTGRIEKD